MEYILKTDKLTKYFGDKAAINQLDISVEKGSIYGLLGRNGAGKTTAIRSIMGLCTFEGKVSLFGKNPKSDNSVYHRIGSMVETPGFYENLSGYENLRIMTQYLGLHKKTAIEDALSFVALDSERNKKVSKYSLGMKQRLALARAMMHEPNFLILDEPINGLDPIGIKEIRGIFKRLNQEKGVSFLISSHILSEIEQLADTIGIIQDGKMVREVKLKDVLDENKNYVEIVAQNINGCIRILEDKLSITNVVVTDNNKIKIYDFSHTAEVIGKTLIENEIYVSGLHVCEESLESIFAEMIGGNEIG